MTSFHAKDDELHTSVGGHREEEHSISVVFSLKVKETKSGLINMMRNHTMCNCNLRLSFFTEGMDIKEIQESRTSYSRFSSAWGRKKVANCIIKTVCKYVEPDYGL